MVLPKTRLGLPVGPNLTCHCTNMKYCHTPVCSQIIITCIIFMGVDHWGDRGTSPPRIWSGGTLMQIVPPRFCHIGTKMSVLWPSKYAKIRFRPGLCPGPRWGSSRRSPIPLSRLERGHPSSYPTPLGTDPPLALAMRPPQKSNQIYAYDHIMLVIGCFELKILKQ